MKKLLAMDIRSLRLLGVCAALGLLLLLNMLWQPRAHLPRPTDEPAATDAPDTEAAAEPAKEAVQAREVQSLSAYGATLQRPLFVATRRPAPVASGTAQGNAPPKPKAPPRSNLTGIRLTGVIMTAERAFGLLSIPGQSELMRAHEGEVVKGWKVAAVEEDAIVLDNGEEDYRMALWREKAAQGAAVTRQDVETGGPQAGGQPPGNRAGGRP